MGMDAAKLLAQVAAIRKLNTAFDGFRLFAGVECDILRDGSLDFSDEVLSQLDYVVASVHSGFNLSESEMTRRVIRAMENPFVTMLAHPTGRLLLKREPYRIDIPAVLDTAAETGTWIEINAAPKRLDLDWRWWPLAKQKGVKCVINPDAHRTRALAGPVVWHRHRAQRLADQRGGHELCAAQQNRTCPPSKTQKVERAGSPRTARRSVPSSNLLSLRHKHSETFAGSAGFDEFGHRQLVTAVAALL